MGMRTRPFGPLDRSLPVIGLGTWQLERDDRAAAIAAIHRGVELGMTHVDTAEMYGSGHVEELLGEALAGRRDQVFLASKVLPEHGSRAGVIDQSLVIVLPKGFGKPIGGVNGPHKKSPEPGDARPG